ncbi:4-hydroxythreonine-4-phosphate dehydrogenase PdxA [Alloalcanivorax xenomutans]|jgi:4-hydroxythreonine-4-phosphate dehydrogenase|uniref:4-hydroxythreonine-4-phosphate dehydrogenase n=1 Tax=Alloalcanivorax xenomutans TaxID=1094342 RepID=A0A9Q3VXV0_9GAMM|nr:4-hydroxythreonine-4-phosphate dehydrogenase PdxA [Alloalcanivorax xenomutans]ARB44804.1 4-hydroxythreonine-4-phosphate dehydrogenase [Alloalcanivorax xenomutans]MCE7507095.1 4-hydroxythreonine-4-phosphate dehydrogenase PdxA [Alloalcanivorax xenomutans]
MTAPIVITSGDPAGIGPDLMLDLPRRYPDTALVVLADRRVLHDRARSLGLQATWPQWQPGDAPPASPALWHCPAGAPVTAGQPDPATASGTLTMLGRAARGCLDGQFSALVTAPVAKSIIREGADPAFTGHTEFFAEQAGVKQVVMMLTAKTLRVALATTHLPLSRVAEAITGPSLETTLHILCQDLRDKFAIDSPRILVLGLNPHAGEGGHLGREEIEIIEPALTRLRQQGLSLTGPVPADTAFQPELLARHDAVLAMYHDQGLPVLKYAGFGEAVNITLGLPFIRTSVDHGTAFDLAGSGRIRAGSLHAAIDLALELVEKRSS